MDGRELQVAQAIIEHTNGSLDFWACKVKGDAVVEPLKEMAQQLVCYHPKKRPGVDEMMKHAALESIKWKALTDGQLESPLHKQAANLLHRGLQASDADGELPGPEFKPPFGDHEWCADF